MLKSIKRKGGCNVKKFLIGAVLLLTLAACSEKENVSVSNETLASSNKELEAQIEKLLLENQELKQLIEQRPNVSDEQLRTTLNLSLSIIHAMVNKDYSFLESIVDSSVTISEEDNSFLFEEHEQKFLQSIDFERFEYRFHDTKNDTIIVGFASNYTSDLVFRFIHQDDNYKLISFITN